MADQIEIRGTVHSFRRLRGEWGACEIATADRGTVRATGDIGHLSKGDEVQALGRMRTTKWSPDGELLARAILPVALLPALAEIEAVTDRFLPRRPSRGAVLGLVIVLGKSAAAIMRENPFLPVVDDERAVKGWGYGSAAQYADLCGIPQDAEVRATAAVSHLWSQLADGSVVVSRDRLESRIAAAAGIDGSAAKRWVDIVVRDGRLEPIGAHQVAWRADAVAERTVARLLIERMRRGAAA